MLIRTVVLWTDVVLVGLALVLCAYAYYVGRHPRRRVTWQRVFVRPSAMVSSVVLGFFFLIALLDSLHFQSALPTAANEKINYNTQVESLLDVVLGQQAKNVEESYSRPLATHALTKISQAINGEILRDYPPLKHAGQHLKKPTAWFNDVLWRVGLGCVTGSFLTLFCAIGLAAFRAKKQQQPFFVSLKKLGRNQTALPWRAALMTLAVIFCVGFSVAFLSGEYHVLGTDRVGNDVLYQVLKSVRCAFVIGVLSSLATLPFAVFFGVLAGYFKGWVDSCIQYFYTVLSSIPNVLLIAACVLMMQVFIDTHPHWFATNAQRADLRLFLLCIILGVTGWAGLCRLLRAETLKLRELDYVQAAHAFGVGSWRIMARHILPNLLHLIIITTVLDFSALVLYEAVLSYVGVGVDPTMNSFGGMINLARSEMSRDPVVWWPFTSAFMAMLTLVLAANLFADAVSDAFNPSVRIIKK
jgi:peptide/nickel transport system permease protein